GIAAEQGEGTRGKEEGLPALAVDGLTVEVAGAEVARAVGRRVVPRRVAREPGEILLPPAEAVGQVVEVAFRLHYRQHPHRPAAAPGAPDHQLVELGPCRPERDPFEYHQTPGRLPA